MTIKERLTEKEKAQLEQVSKNLERTERELERMERAGERVVAEGIASVVRKIQRVEWSVARLVTHHNRPVCTAFTNKRSDGISLKVAFNWRTGTIIAVFAERAGGPGHGNAFRVGQHIIPTPKEAREAWRKAYAEEYGKKKSA